MPTLPRDLGNRFLDIVKLDDYQEPYQALKYAPYYSYSTVVMEMKDMMLNNKGSNINHSGMPVHGRLALFCTYARAYHPYVYACACIYMYVYNIHVYKYTGGTRSKSRLRVRMYRTTKHSPDRNQYTVPLHPLLSASPPPPPLPPLLYHPQRCTRMVQLTHRTIMRYRNSARCPCSTRTEQDAAHPPRPPPPRPATRTPSSPRPRRAEVRRRTRRYVYIEKCQLTFEWRIVNYVVLLNDEIAET